MTKLAWEPEKWDVVVVCADQEFKGNSSVLSRVPFFKAALSNGFAESDAKRIPIGNTSVAAFRAVWHYLYTDDSVSVAKLDAAAELLDVLSLGKRFELPLLTQASNRRLIQIMPTLPPDVLCQVFRVAKLHEQPNLYAACQHWIGEIGGDFLKQDCVWDMICKGDRALYEEVVNATMMKRRRTV